VICLAGIATELGHQEEAFGWLNCLDRTGELFRTGQSSARLLRAALVHHFAILHCNLGQCGKALPCAERSVQMYERD
jgi:hypothetical protein